MHTCKPLLVEMVISCLLGHHRPCAGLEMAKWRGAPKGLGHNLLMQVSTLHIKYKKRLAKVVTSKPARPALGESAT